MTVISNRDGRLLRGVRGARAATALLSLVGLLLVSACGMGAQTLKPYTPAEGVNFDVGNNDDPDSVVHVRNLLVVSRAVGSGFVSASIVTTGTDSLTGVSGTAIKSDDSPGAAWTATLAKPIPLAPNTQVVLTNQSPLLGVESADLTAGLTTDITVDFGRAGSYTTQTTVVDGRLSPYNTISPSPSGGASPSASPSPSS